MSVNEKSRKSGEESRESRIESRESKTVFGLMILHLLIALPVAYLLNIWADEASTLYTTEHGFVRAFQNVFADEKQAPLYFLALSVWREISHSIFFARFFSIVFSLLAINVFYALARRLFERQAAGFITAVFAFHPFLIWASLEIRVYSLVIFLSVLLLKLFFDGYLDDAEDVSREGVKAQRKTQIFYVLTAVIALYTNYYLGFLLVGNFFALLVLRKWSAARNYFLQMLIAGAAILPLLWAIKSQFTANTDRFQADKSLFTGLRFLWNDFLSFVLPTELFPPDVSTNISFLRVWIVRLAILAALVLLVKKRRVFDKNILAFGTICAAIFSFILLAYFLIGDIFVELRHAAVLFAPLVLFAALVWQAFFGNADKEKRRREEEEKRARSFAFIAPALVLILLAAFFSYSLYTLYPNLTKRGDWARVAEFIRQNEQPGQPIIVFTAFDVLALPYTYQGANRILPDEKFFAFESEAEKGSADAWRNQTDFIISEIPLEAREIWLLTNDKCAIKDACAPLENFVQANYTVIEEKDFYREKVRLLRRK